jgi:hypothetical protein
MVMMRRVATDVAGAVGHDSLTLAVQKIGDTLGFTQDYRRFGEVRVSPIFYRRFGEVRVSPIFPAFFC